MIPTAQFDPATLTIWTTTGALLEPAAGLAAAAVRAAARGENPSALLESIPLGHPLRTRLLWFASSMWHEKRHFMDTCLTNYGARRFRDLFNLACNFVPLLAMAQSRGEPVWFPVEIYGCPVQRRVLSIPEPTPETRELARLAKAMKGLMSQLDAAVGIKGDRIIHLGGQAQMEGLAQVSQIMSLEHCFGIDNVQAVTAEYVHRLPREGPYRAIESVSGVLGCAKLQGNFLAVNPGLAAALFVTSLCGRFYGAGAQPAADLISPWQRFARLLEELGPGAGRFDMPDDEAAALVDRVASRLWGRTAFEEIAADIDAMEAKLDPSAVPWLAAEGLDEVFADFLDLRRRLLAAARELGPASVLPRAFPLLWRDRLLPWHVVATPGGSAEDDDSPVVFGADLNLPPEVQSIFPSRVAWGRLDSASSDDQAENFAPSAREAWLQMLERHGPRAQLMLNGRRHRRMVPPELERPLDEIEQLGVQVQFHPRFKWPELRDQSTRTAEAVALAAFSGRTSFICDITGEELEPAAAAVLTPWEFRHSALLPIFRQGGFFNELKLATDWSDWVVRRDLLE
jgi:hypothetical protein